MFRFFILFLGLLGFLFFLEILQWSQTEVILPFTAGLAKISAVILQFFDADVSATGKVLRSISSGFAVEIQPGCNGVEAVIILFAAIFAFPATFKQKMFGFVLGFFAIQILNLGRIISLFYLGQWNLVWFEWFHLYIWQALIILDALVVWLIWLRRLPENNAAVEPEVAPS